MRFRFFLKRNFIRFFLILAVLGYFLYQVLTIVLPPKISIIEPLKDATTKEESILVKGFVKRVYYLKINGEPTRFQQDGFFEGEVRLKEGQNFLTFEAESRFKKKQIVTRRVFRENQL